MKSFNPKKQMMKDAFPPQKFSYSNSEQNTFTKEPIKILTAAAMMLPGLWHTTVQAADEDSVDFQYSHYQEGRREGTFITGYNQSGSVTINQFPVPNNRNPIEVDRLHGSARVSLTDRIKFAFNYIQDTWSGATPFGSAPERSGAYSYKGPRFDANGNLIMTGASGYANAKNTFLDSQGHPLYQSFDPVTGQATFLKDRTVHVLSYASPETRKQGDFRLGYEWD